MRTLALRTAVLPMETLPGRAEYATGAGIRFVGCGWAFIAPKILGGVASQTPVSGKGIEQMSDAIQLQDIDIQNIKGDILIKGKICSRE